MYWTETNKLVELGLDLLTQDPDWQAVMFLTAAQVGILLSGITVDNIVFGGPAYNSQKIFRGDIIREVRP